MTIENRRKVEVEIRRHDAKTMILRQGIGEGETAEGEKFDMSMSMSNGDPVWYFSGEGRYYSVSLKELTEKMLDVRESLKQGGI